MDIHGIIKCKTDVRRGVDGVRKGFYPSAVESSTSSSQSGRICANFLAHDASRSTRRAYPSVDRGGQGNWIATWLHFQEPRRGYANCKTKGIVE